MSDYITVFNSTPQKHTRTDWKDYWNIIYETDDEMYFMSKEIYKYNYPEENRVFDYNLVLELQIVYDEDNEKETLFSTLYLVPTMKYIHQSIKEETMKSQCINNEDDIFLTDLLFEYQFPLLGHETPNLDFDVFDKDNINISKYLLSASIVSECISNLLGFSLDKVVNRIGTTNWDLLDGALTGIDPFKQSLDRISEQMRGNE